MRIEKYEFTYEDYLNYCDSLYCHATKEILCVKEDGMTYTIDEKKKKTGDKKHDKIFKEILQNPQEMVMFINNFTKHRVNADELENYSENFLVEHQTKVDYSMPYRILNYCVEIIRSVVEPQSEAICQYPKVVPIVLYTYKK